MSIKSFRHNKILTPQNIFDLTRRAPRLAPLTSMPNMAGEDVRLHDAVQFWESAQTALAHEGLLKAAIWELCPTRPTRS